MTESRGDGPAQAVLRANVEQQALRKAMETQEELQKIQDRVCFALSAYEVGEELRLLNENNLKEINDSFVKNDTQLQFVDDMANLHTILADPIAKRKYQQKVTIFVVGYENLCTDRHKLLSQIQNFFDKSSVDENTLVIDPPEFDLEEVGNNVREALDKAEKTTERLANISREVIKVFDVLNPKDHKKGKKKLEKALYQSQQDVMHLTEKLVSVQSDLEETKNKLNILNQQIETKDIEIEKLKLQLNRNKSVAVESDNFKKALEAKEQQLQKYISQMEEAETALSQAESKYDNYVESNKILQKENERLLKEIENLNKGHQQTLIKTRKELEQKYDEEVKNMKENHEDVIRKMKDGQEEETKLLKEKLNMIRWSSAQKSQLTTPTTADSAVSRISSSRTEYSLKSNVTKILKVHETSKDTISRTNTAEISSRNSTTTDSALDVSQSIVFTSNNNTPLSSQTQNTSGHSANGLTNIISQKKTIMLENSTQTEENFDDISETSSMKSKQELEEFEIELAKTPSEELPGKLEEYKNKFMEVQKDLEEEIFQWKLKYNSKSETLNQLFATHENEMKEKEEILEQLALVRDHLAQTEKEAENAILQLEELQTEKTSEESSSKTPISPHEVSTMERATSALQLPPVTNDKQVIKEDRLQSPGDLFAQQSVAIQCPSTSDMNTNTTTTPVYHQQLEIEPSDSGFDGDTSPNISQVVGKTDATVPSSSARVRSRLIRSALKDHQVINHTIQIFETLTEFKLNVNYWLQENGLDSQLITTIPDIILDKNDNLDVISKLPVIHSYIKQLLEALLELSSNLVKNQEDEDRIRQLCNIYTIDSSITTDGRASSTTMSFHERINSGKRARSMQTDKLKTPTTPKGYTHLLHEYNNLNEKHLKMEQEHQNIVKKHRQEISENSIVMTEMQELINTLKLQLLENKQEKISSVMFTRLDAERNVKTLKKALQAKRIPQNLYDKAVTQMDCYIQLPGKRLSDLVRRYAHHCYMKDIEENLSPVNKTSSNVFAMQERMEELQKERAERWSKKMGELRDQRSLLSDEITSSLNEIEESSGLFLIKPIYSYSSRPQLKPKALHPIICKKQDVRKTNENSSEKLTIKQENPTNIAVQTGRMWNMKQSQQSDSIIAHNDIPRLLAMDVNQLMISKNPISMFTNKQSQSDRLSGVRQYVTIERRINHQINDKVDGYCTRTRTPPISQYATLPPIVTSPTTP